MKTTDPRDMTWDEIRDHLAGPRALIWTWLRANGPATTSRIAEAAHISILSVRPRVSELAVLGFAECIAREGREGVYQAVTLEVRAARHAEEVRESQLPLKLS